MQVVSKNIARHRHEECPNRQMKCRVGCGEFFMAKDLQYHEEEVCRRECKYLCGERIGPTAKRVHHELNVCENRPRSCQFKCGIQGLTAKYQQEHEENQCTRTPLFCPNNCGKMLERKELQDHISIMGNHSNFGVSR